MPVDYTDALALALDEKEIYYTKAQISNDRAMMIAHELLQLVLGNYENLLPIWFSGTSKEYAEAVTEYSKSLEAACAAYSKSLEAANAAYSEAIEAANAAYSEANEAVLDRLLADIDEGRRGIDGAVLYRPTGEPEAEAGKDKIGHGIKGLAGSHAATYAVAAMVARRCKTATERSRKLFLQSQGYVCKAWLKPRPL